MESDRPESGCDMNAIGFGKEIVGCNKRSALHRSFARSIAAGWRNALCLLRPTRYRAWWPRGIQGKKNGHPKVAVWWGL